MLKRLFAEEPVMVIVTGVGVVVQAFIALLIAFGVPITPAEQVAVGAFIAVVTGVVARSQVQPVDRTPTPGQIRGGP